MITFFTNTTLLKAETAMQSQNPIPMYPTQSGTTRNSSTTTREELVDNETKHVTAQQGMKAIFY